MDNEEKRKCPWCGSDSARKNGKRPNGTQSYRCNKCKKRFQLEYAPSHGRPKGSKNRHPFSYRKVIEKFEAPEDPEEDFKPRVFPIKEQKPLPSVNSLVGVPCFGCSVNHCDPTTCKLLDTWLGLCQFPLMVITVKEKAAGQPREGAKPQLANQ